MLSAISVLLSSHFGEITSAKGISWDLEMGSGCSPLKIILKTYISIDYNNLTCFYGFLEQLWSISDLQNSSVGWG